MTENYQLNPLFDGLKSSSTLRINEAVNALWQSGEQVYHMGFGESRFNVHPDLQAALAANADKKSYLPARGLAALTQAVAAYYSHKLGTEFKASQVMVGPGSKLLIYALQMVLNADLFLPTPSWVSYAPQAALLGIQSRYVASARTDPYQLDLAALDKLVKASTNPMKMLLINSPNNPSGQMLSADFLMELADYCRANNVLVLSDEIYFQVSHGEVEHVSISAYYPEGTLVLGGLSKHLSIGGWRLGVALLPETSFGNTLMERLRLFASETWSCVAAPIQYAAIKAYSLDPAIEQYVDDCSAIHGIRTRFCRQALVAAGIKCSRAEGAFYLAANFDKYAAVLSMMKITTSAQLADHLLDVYHIASLPGSDFGLPVANLTLRLSTSYLDMESNEAAQRIYDLYQSGVEAEHFMSAQNHPVTNAALAAFAKFTGSLAAV